MRLTHHRPDRDRRRRCNLGGAEQLEVQPTLRRRLAADEVARAEHALGAQLIEPRAVRPGGKHRDAARVRAHVGHCLIGDRDVERTATAPARITPNSVSAVSNRLSIRTATRWRGATPRAARALAIRAVASANSRQFRATAPSISAGRSASHRPF